MSLPRVLAVVTLACAGLAGVAVPASAAGGGSAAPAGRTPAPVSALGTTGVDDFEFASLDVAYRLGRDDSGRSTLSTVEHFVAIFPDFDQNRGIRRAIPRLYDGHSTNISILGVTDENGAPREYVTSQNGDFLEITVAVPPGSYVHGEQHYIFEYTQTDVTRYFEDTNDDEFYWDVNGTGWAQPFGEVRATVQLDEALAALVTETACYRGPSGSTQSCEATASGGAISVSETGLGSYENVTMVIAFPAGTFTAAPFDLFTWVPWPAVAGIGAGLLAGIIAILSRIFLIRDAKGRGIVVAQYEPPPRVSLFLAAELLGRRNKAMAATIVDLAVRRKLRILERDGRWGRREFGVQRLPGADSDLLPDEQRILDALFASRYERAAGLFSAFSAERAPAPQGVHWLARNDTALGRHVVAVRKSNQKLAVSSGLRRTPPRWPLVLVIGVGAIGFLLLLGVANADLSELSVTVSVLGMIVVAWIVIGSAVLVGKKPLTSRGAELKEHLEGLREFIGWAEADRLRMLQSVTGAERTALDGSAVGPDDRGRIVKVYERLLPYAVLFGQEREWARELEKYYVEQNPDWYSGTSSAFTFSAFSSSIASLSSSVSSSYSGSSGSSSSGGSGGGGSSGGGGGGGGGGGV